MSASAPEEKANKTHRRRFRLPRYSLRTLLLFMLLFSAALALWRDWSPWQVQHVLRNHEMGVSSATFSPDGRRILTASWDKTARVWDAETGSELHVLRGHRWGVSSAAFSADGRRIVSASVDQTARVWDSETGSELLVLKGHKDMVMSAAFSPDGIRIVTASDDDTARVWDAETGRELLVLRGHKRQVKSAAFTPNGHRIVTASYDRTACVWDAETGRTLHVLRGHQDDFYSAAFSPDGHRILVVNLVSNIARVLLRVRPENRSGVFWLPQFWTTALLAAAFLWSIYRDRRIMKAEARLLSHPGAGRLP